MTTEDIVQFIDFIDANSMSLFTLVSDPEYQVCYSTQNDHKLDFYYLYKGKVYSHTESDSWKSAGLLGDIILSIRHDLLLPTGKKLKLKKEL